MPRRRVKRYRGAVLITSAVIAAGASVFTSVGYDRFSPTPDAANLFIDPDGGTCVRSASPVAYDTATACASFDAANDVAASGDRVGVTCGGAATAIYDNQTITGSNARTDYVTFSPIVGCDPEIGHQELLTADYVPGAATITVASTAKFDTSKVFIAGNTSGNITCTGKTATQLTGCTGGPSETITLRGDIAEYSANLGQEGVLTIQGSWIRVTGIDAIAVVLDDGPSQPVSSNLIFENGTSTSFNVSGATACLIQNWYVGPKRSGNPATFISADDAGGGSDCVFDDVTWDVNNVACLDPENDDCHMEAIFWRYSDGLIIRNSRFIKYAEYAIFSEPSGSFGCVSPCADTHRPRNWTIENTFFGPGMCKDSPSSTNRVVNYPCGVAGNNSMHMKMSTNGGRVIFDNWNLLFNTFAMPMRLDDCAGCTTGAASTVRGNYGKRTTSCDARFGYSENVWTDGAVACDASDLSTASALNVVDLLSDWHLTATSEAIGNGGATFPANDIDGDARTNPADAGADERTS